MRHEPTELANGAPWRRPRVLQSGARKRVAADMQSGRKTTAAIDEAFAHFDTPAVCTPEIAAKLASQLNALDHQRAHLAQLLRSVEASSL